MIPRGHKIVVLSSSTAKSGAKIRKGSTGFIAGIGKTHDFSRQQMYITPAKIVFTRYGYENTQRNETKFVTLIHPAADPSRIKYVQKFLNKLTTNSLDMTDRLRKHFVKEGVTGKPTASIVIDRACKNNNLLSNLNDLKAWTSSILQGGTLHSVVMASQSSNLNVAKTALIDGYPEFEARLKQCVLHRKQSNNFIDSIADNQELKALLIKKLRGFLTLQARNDIQLYSKDFGNRWIPEAQRFHLLWYFLSNNLTLPEGANSLFGLKTYKTNTEIWMQLFASIK